MSTTDFNAALQASSVAEEARIVHATPCRCGGRFTIKSQELILNPATQKHYDRLTTGCLQCGEKKVFLFDITSFFGKSMQRSPVQVESAGPTYASLTFAFTLCLILAAVGAGCFLVSTVAVTGAGSAADRSKGQTAGLLLGIGFSVCAALIHSKRARLGQPPADLRDVQRELDSSLSGMENVFKRHGIELNWTSSDANAALLGGMTKAALFQGCKLLDAGKLDEAIASFSATITLLQKESGADSTALLASTYCLRGAAFEKKQFIAEARNDYQSALKLQPQHVQASAALARLKG